MARQVGAWYDERGKMTLVEYDDGTLEGYKFSAVLGREVRYTAKVGEIKGLIAIPFDEEDEDDF